MCGGIWRFQSKSQNWHQPDANIAKPTTVAKPAPLRDGINVYQALQGLMNDKFKIPGAKSKSDLD